MRAEDFETGSTAAGLVGKSRRDGRVQSDEINRHVYREEFLQAIECGRSLGLRRLDARSVGGADRLVRAASV